MRKSILYRMTGSGTKCVLSLVLWVLMSFTGALAQSIEALEYQYDAAGNLIGYTRSVSTGTPVIDSVTPGIINRESTFRVRLTGQNFAGSSVTVDQAGLAVLQTDILSNTELQIFLSVSDDANLGPADINVVSALGQDSAQILVGERLPIISTNPNPILLTVGANPQTVTLSFDQPFAVDQVYAVRLVDDGVASITTTSMTLPAGQTEVTLDITGNALG